jgi:SNF2 family DNA or RNA helicase
VLPFILRRTKDAVAQDLPSKTVVDILCPLSTEQERMYREYQQRLRTSDEQLEGELKVIGNLDEVLPPAGAAETTETPEQDAGVSADGDDFPALGGWATLGGATGLAQSALLPAWEQDAQHDAVNAKPASRTHALESLNYLKQLCVHPALVVDAQHARYRNRLLQSTDSSGKLRKLAALLLESGVIMKEECGNQAQLAQLLEAAEPDVEKSLQRGADEDSEASTSDGKSDSEDEKDEQESSPTSTAAVGTGKKRKASAKAVPARNLRKRRAGGSTAKAAQAAENAAELVQHDLSVELARPKHRCLVFAQHKATLDLVEELVLRRYFPQIGYRRLDGDVEPGKRAAVAREFNDQAAAQRKVGADSGCTSSLPVDAQVERLRRALPVCATAKIAADDGASAAPAPDIRLLLMTTRSCGLGLNLTAADTVIFVEHDWNPFADLQAMDRVHRLGQTQPVTVYRLLGKRACDAIS